MRTFNRSVEYRIHVTGLAGLTTVVLCVLAAACRPSQSAVRPSIEFTRLPPAGEGSSEVLDPIEGRVTGARRGERVVLFAQSGVWWVQPVGDRPFTAIQADSKWKSSTHPGSAYAALLVGPEYRPPATLNELPQTGGAVRAIALAEGPALLHPPPKTIYFGGYEWGVRSTPGSPGGTRNLYDPSNAWVDKQGLLHLRIARSGNTWSAAEINLSRSLGYGSYRFVVRDVSRFEPAVALAICTWDDDGPYREMDIEISRWGASTGQNAQFVVQPYYIAANVVRFLAPPGPLAYSFSWEPGRVSFKSARPSAAGNKSGVVAAHVFTSGVPAPGTEKVRINLYVFDSAQSHLQHEVEVIIEKFEYLP